MGKKNDIKLSIDGSTGSIHTFRGKTNISIGKPRKKFFDTTGTGTGTGTSGAGFERAIVIESLSYPENDDISTYTVQKVDSDDVPDGIDIIITTAIGSEGITADGADDLRNYVPWMLKDSFYYIVESSGDPSSTGFVFLQTLTFGGNEENSSLRFNEDEGFTQCVWA